MIELYTQGALRRDVPEHGIKRGDVATIIDYVPHRDNQEQGYILEVFNAVGSTVAVFIVEQSAVEPLTADEVFSVRMLHIS
ncbi:MAG: DUF4926 domain-containing protein [bacterium]|nr:DUF4926 domain-containing protein [bacterium]